MIVYRELAFRDDDLALLTVFYESVYVAGFPDPDERESFDNMVGYLRLKQEGWYGRNNYHIVIALADEQPVAGSISDYLAAADAGVVEFLFVTDAFRRRGIGRTLLEHTHVLLERDALSRSERPLACIVAEMNDPFAASPVSDNMDPWERAVTWHDWGYRGLDFPYLQPALSERQRPVDRLILIAKILRDEWRAAMPGSVIQTLVHEYLHWAMRIERPESSPDYGRMAAHLEQTPYVRTLSLAAYVGRDPGRPLSVHEVVRADEPDFTSVLELYRRAFGRGPLSIDEAGFRTALSAVPEHSRYHLWALRVHEDVDVEGFASFFSLTSAGFGGYVALFGALRRSGRFPLLLARIEEQILRDRPDAHGWYVETSMDADPTPFLRVGFRELPVHYVQPALAASEPVPARLMFKRFGRRYGPHDLERAHLLAALEQILQVVYGIVRPQAHPTYRNIQTQLDSQSAEIL